MSAKLCAYLYVMIRTRPLRQRGNFNDAANSRGGNHKRGNNTILSQCNFIAILNILNIMIHCDLLSIITLQIMS